MTFWLQPLGRGLGYSILAMLDLSRSKAALIDKAREKQEHIYPITPKAFS